MWKAMSLIAGVLFAASPASAQSLIGQWTNCKGNAVVQVERCGNAYCGRVIKATAKARQQAREAGTANLVGTRILTGLRPVGGGKYRGNAFIPKRNIRGSATVRQLSPEVMEVQGCVLGGTLCDKEYWMRVG